VEQRRLGKYINGAAIEAAALRFRPVMMTSFAFIFGLFPLVIAQGAGAATRFKGGRISSCKANSTLTPHGRKFFNDFSRARAREGGSI